jgi:hypothetical protein
MRYMAGDWFSGSCGGPRVRELDDGSYEIEILGRPSKPITEQVKQYQELISQWATVYGIPQAVIAGVVMQESRGDRTAVSSDGGIGLMQLTAKGVKGGHSDQELIDNPSLNIELGSKLLNLLWEKYNGNIIHVLTSYNAGSPRCGGKNPWNLINTDNYVGSTIDFINGAIDSGYFKKYPDERNEEEGILFDWKGFIVLVAGTAAGLLLYEKILKRLPAESSGSLSRSRG